MPHDLVKMILIPQEDVSGNAWFQGPFYQHDPYSTSLKKC
jgi:hypothetical protein